MSRLVDLKCPWLAVEDVTAKVLRWLVAEQDRVEIDQDIMVMLLDGEEFLLPSPIDGIIKTVLAEPGELIEPDQVLAIIRLE
jgi:pyruvate/2-oxoglutarate dehydrogenase complex dihydrolipoamide acyltransferase (E2) component